MIWDFKVCLLAAAIALQLITRLHQLFKAPSRKVKTGARVLSKVCFSCGSHEPWQTAATSILERSSGHAKICVFVTCRRDEAIVVPPYLRSMVEIQTCAKSPSLKKFVERFVTGEETFVGVVDKKLSVVHNWDEVVATAILHAAASAAPANLVLTVPASSFDAAFPVVGRRGERVPSLEFKTTASGSVPSVVLCPEFVAASPSTLMRAVDGDAENARALAQRGFHVECPAAQVLEKCHKNVCKTLERATPPTPWQGREHLYATCGLSAKPYVDEMNLKYGSAEKARLAVSLRK